MKTQFDFTQTFIRVDVNPRIAGGYFYDTRLFGKLPRCRKSQLLTTQVTRGGIILRPLFGQSDAQEFVPAEEYRAFLKKLAVKSGGGSINDEFLYLTPGLVSLARAHEEAVCDCPAVRG